MPTCVGLISPTENTLTNTVQRALSGNSLTYITYISLSYTMQSDHPRWNSTFFSNDNRSLCPFFQNLSILLLLTLFLFNSWNIFLNLAHDANSCMNAIYKRRYWSFSFVKKHSRQYPCSTAQAQIRVLINDYLQLGVLHRNDVRKSACFIGWLHSDHSSGQKPKRKRIL